MLGLVWTLCFLAAASNAEQTVSAAARSAQEKPQALAQEIADIEAQIDAILDAAIAGIPSLLPGSPQRVPALGKILFFDKELSVNRNEACAFCHMPQTGFQGAIEKSQFGRRGNARLGTNALQLQEASKRSLCGILTAALLR